jgi:hypothetical protein
MTYDEFENIYPLIVDWLFETRRIHAAKSHPIAALSFPRLQHYFSVTTLAASKVVLVDQVPIPPLSAWGATQFEDFERSKFDGVTYRDTIFIERAQFDNESLHFHELIHIVQWRFLGAKLFLFAYANGLERYGYSNSPLEVMAYDAERTFNSSSYIFDAEDFVAQRLATDSWE